VIFASIDQQSECTKQPQLYDNKITTWHFDTRTIFRVEKVVGNMERRLWESF
jgi:hypothetical protein